MLGWLVEKTRRDKQFSADMMRAEMLEDRLHRLSQALATISIETLTGKDGTERAENAAATLTTSVVGASIGQVKDDDDRFVAGIFAFVFADYFSSLLDGTFEFASSFAVLRVLGSGLGAVLQYDSGRIQHDGSIEVKVDRGHRPGMRSVVQKPRRTAVRNISRSVQDGA
jgi:hypothetical protein